MVGNLLPDHSKNFQTNLYLLAHWALLKTLPADQAGHHGVISLETAITKRNATSTRFQTCVNKHTTTAKLPVASRQQPRNVTHHAGSPKRHRWAHGSVLVACNPDAYAESYPRPICRNTSSPSWSTSSGPLLSDRRVCGPGDRRQRHRTLSSQDNRLLRITCDQTEVQFGESHWQLVRSLPPSDQADRLTTHDRDGAPA